MCVIPKSAYVLLELSFFKASEIEQLSAALINGQICRTRLPTRGPICELGLSAQHLGMLEANSRFPEDEHYKQPGVI